MQQEIFQLVRNENTKNEHAGIKRKKIWRKNKRKRVSSSNIYIVKFEFLFQLAPKPAGRSLMKWFHFLSFEKFFLLPFSTPSLFSLLSRNKSSHRMCSKGKAVLDKFATFTRKQLCWSHFLIKWQVWRSSTLLKTESNPGVLLWIFRAF